MLIGSRPGREGKAHFLVIRRRCQTSSVPGVTIRPSRTLRESKRASTERMARSGHDKRGRRPVRRRNTATSCRNARILTFLVAVRRATGLRQANAVPGVGHISRNTVIRAHGLIAELNETPGRDRVPVLARYRSRAARHGKMRIREMCPSRASRMTDRTARSAATRRRFVEVVWLFRENDHAQTSMVQIARKVAAGPISTCTSTANRSWS